MALAAAVAACAACGGRNVKTADGKADGTRAAQTVTVTPDVLENGAADTLRFGRMHQGETATKNLRVENGCGKPIVPLRHVTSCGCVTVDYARRPIPPEESMVIGFEFDSRGEYGWQMKLMELYFAGSDSPLKFYVVAEVE